jgi:hypothetical protein
MKVLFRIVSAFLALGLLAGVVHLGILSGTNTKFVVWFGIASAIAAPIGLSLLTFAFARSDADLIQRLAKVPEIERLVTEAKTQEDKLRVLEAEQARLAEVIRFESRRQTVRDRVGSLEHDAVRILGELENLDAEALTLEEAIGRSVASDEIARLRDRVRSRERGDIMLRFGTRLYRIDRDIVNALPFGFGNIFVAYLRLLERLRNRPTGTL